MTLTTTPTRELSITEAEAVVQAGGMYVDLRAVPDYLDVHVPGSLCLQYEFGPGLAGRARDCVPLDIPLVLLDHGADGPRLEMREVVATLRGKGFGVPGFVADGLKVWSESVSAPTSTETLESKTPPEGALLNVGDPGSALVADATLIPLEELWARIDELPKDRVVITAGRGVRAGMAVGMLERAGCDEILFWRYRPKG